MTLENSRGQHGREHIAGTSVRAAQHKGITVIEARTLVEAKPRDTIQDFQTGDTVRVNVLIREGERQRVQAFEGVVLKGRYRQGDSPAPGATFTVRRVSYSVGVERTFLVCSPLLDSLEVTRKGKVRRARAYYLRGLTGRSARIKERR